MEILVFLGKGRSWRVQIDELCGFL